MNNEDTFTASGTNINEVKRKNAAAGLSYNEVKELLAKSGGYGMAIYSDTNKAEVQKENSTYKNDV